MCTSLRTGLLLRTGAWLRKGAWLLASAWLCCPADARTEGVFMGVNLSGAEINPGLGKRLNFDYTYPPAAEFDYFKAKGFNTVRLPFDATRVYPTALGPLNPAELRQLKGEVATAAARGMSLILDPHNYGEIFDSRIGRNRLIGRDDEGTRLFADFWKRLAETFAGSPNVIFGLMNEPHLQSSVEWRTGAERAIEAIRAAGARQLILIPGTSYTGAHFWTAPGGNGEAWAGFRGDPLHHYAFEMHQYLDSDSSGTHPQCSRGAGASRLTSATAWLKRNGAKGFLGEFAWSTDPSCTGEAGPLMRALDADLSPWLGWTWWAGGPWWPQNYMFVLDPERVRENGTEKLQDRSQLLMLQATIRRVNGEKPN